MKAYANRFKWRTGIVWAVLANGLLLVPAYADDVLLASPQYGLQVRQELNTKYGCTLELDRPNSTADCRECSSKVMGQLKADQKTIVHDIDEAFGQIGLGPDTAPGVFAAAASQMDQDKQDNVADLVKLTHYWAMEAAKLEKESEAARAHGNDYAKYIFDPNLKAAIKQKCAKGTGVDRNNCAAAVLAQVHAQALTAMKALGKADDRIHWASVASYACQKRVEGWQPIEKLLGHWSETPPKARGSELLAPNSPESLASTAIVPTKSNVPKYHRRPLREPRNKKEAENQCVIDFRNSKGIGGIENENPDDVCRRVQGTELVHFSTELKSLLGDIQGSNYFEVLRMEGVARLMRAHYELLGHYPASPLECGPFHEGMESIRTTPAPAELVARAALKGNKDFLVALNRMAQVIEGQREQARHIWAGAPSKMEQSPVKELKQLEKQIADSLADFPVLGAGRTEGRRVFLGDLPMIAQFAALAPQDPKFVEKMQAVFSKAEPLVAKDIAKQMVGFCSDDTEKGGLSWEDLAHSSFLTDAVLKKFPEFKLMQDCAMDASSNRDVARSFGYALAGLGCIPVAISSTFIGMPYIGAATCAAAGAGIEYANYAHQKNMSYLVDECFRTGAKICSGDDIIKAHDDLSTAIFFAGVGVAASVGGEAHSLAAMVQEARAIRVGKTITVDAIERVAGKLRSAKTASELNLALDELTALRMQGIRDRLAVSVSRDERQQLNRELVSTAVDGTLVKKGVAERIRSDYSALFLKARKTRPLSAEEEKKLITLISILEDRGLDKSAIEKKLGEWLAAPCKV